MDKAYLESYRRYRRDFDRAFQRAREIRLMMLEAHAVQLEYAGRTSGSPDRIGEKLALYEEAMHEMNAILSEVLDRESIIAEILTDAFTRSEDKDASTMRLLIFSRYISMNTIKEISEQFDLGNTQIHHYINRAMKILEQYDVEEYRAQYIKDGFREKYRQRSKEIAAEKLPANRTIYTVPEREM